MSGGLGTPTEAAVEPLGPVLPIEGFADERLVGAGDSGTTASLRRDQLFRRALLVADLAAFVLALLVLSEVASRSLRLTWVSFGGLLALFVGAKIVGLYDRDAALLHKTTLDEAPKLFQVATLGALCAWLAGGFVIAGGTLNRAEALMLWLLLIRLPGRQPGQREGDRVGDGPDRALPVHRRPRHRGDGAAEAVRSWPEGRAGRGHRSGGGIGLVHRRQHSAPRLTRSATWPGRSTCSGRSSRPDSFEAERDAGPRLHPGGGRRQGQRPAAPARGGRLLGRVRRPARGHGDGRKAASADSLVRFRQARLRSRSAPRSACWRSRR